MAVRFPCCLQFQLKNGKEILIKQIIA